mmetsp:Transcript_29225/g.28292  ORF Transcript_29225/g.28292 Transcript_29225/m.28292 type:complete len:155 (-) Transcript_29225:3880-4344(-)
MDGQVRRLFVAREAGKVLALFNNGLIRAVEKNQPLDMKLGSFMNLVEELAKSEQYDLVPLGKTDCKIHGNILRIYDNTHYQDILPYFLVEGAEGQVSLQTVNLEAGCMSVFVVKDFNPRTGSLLLMERDEQYQSVLILRKLDAKEGDQAEYFTR